MNKQERNLLLEVSSFIYGLKTNGISYLSDPSSQAHAGNIKMYVNELLGNAAKETVRHSSVVVSCDANKTDCEYCPDTHNPDKCAAHFNKLVCGHSGLTFTDPKTNKNRCSYCGTIIEED